MKKRTVGRPKKEPDEILVDFSIKISPETMAMIEQIAVQLDRPKGWTGRKLLTRGLAAYLRDALSMRLEDAIREPLGTEPSEILDALRSASKALSQSKNARSEKIARQNSLAEIAEKASAALSRNPTDIEQATAIILESPASATHTLTPQGDEWADEDDAPAVLPAGSPYRSDG